MTESNTPQTLDSLTGKEFEALVAQLVASLGFTIESLSTGPDGGIDILAVSSADLISGHYIIQCKRQSSKVGIRPIRDLLGVVTDQGANKGILITNSQFTKAAVDFAEGNRLELINGKRLKQLLMEHVEKKIPPAEEDLILTPSVLRFLEFIRARADDIQRLIQDQQIGIQRNTILITPRTFSGSMAERKFCQQSLQKYNAIVTILGNQINNCFSGPRVTHETPSEDLAESFNTIKQTVRKALKLQLTVHAAQQVSPAQDQVLQQLKRVYIALFDDLGSLFENIVNSCTQALESPEEAAKRGAIVLDENGAIGITAYTSLSKATEEINKLSRMASGSGCLVALPLIIALILLVGWALYQAITLF